MGDPLNMKSLELLSDGSNKEVGNETKEMNKREDNPKADLIGLGESKQLDKGNRDEGKYGLEFNFQELKNKIRPLSTTEQEAVKELQVVYKQQKTDYQVLLQHKQKIENLEESQRKELGEVQDKVQLKELEASHARERRKLEDQNNAEKIDIERRNEDYRKKILQDMKSQQEELRAAEGARLEQ